MLFAVVAALFILTPRLATADLAPKLHHLIRSAESIGGGTIVATEDFDHGRIRVYDLRLDRAWKPAESEAAQTVRVVAITDQPGAAVNNAGGVGVAFLQPLRRMSYFDRHLQNTAEMWEFVDGRDGWIQAGAAENLEAIVAPISALISESRKPGADPALRAQRRRDLAFALLSAPHPLLAGDGIDSLSAIPDLAATLSDTEAGVVSAALNAAWLPLTARERLIDQVVALDLRKMIGALQGLRAPELQRPTWAALRALGAPVDQKTLREFATAEDPRLRSAAARELLSADPEESIPFVANTALRDRDRQVRLATIEALGESGRAEAIKPLEGVFAGTDLEDRQAAARALREIGGDKAADALARLAFVGPIDAQRYAVVTLLSLGVGIDDPRVRDIAKRHPDEKITEMLEHGVELGHSH